MACETMEIEHIEMKLIDAMPIDYWRGWRTVSNWPWT